MFQRILVYSMFLSMFIVGVTKTHAENWPAGTTGFLAQSCTHSDGTMAGYCRGLVLGVSAVLSANSGLTPRPPIHACVGDANTKTIILKFIKWAKRKSTNLNEEATVGFITYLKETFPCPSPKRAHQTDQTKQTQLTNIGEIPAGDSKKPSMADISDFQISDGKKIDLPISQTETAACLSEERAVEFTGVLSLETFPGRPHYTSIAGGDEPETGYYLMVDVPVCVERYGIETEKTYPIKGIWKLQLNISNPQLRAKIRNLHTRKQKVVVTGKPYLGISGHYHAPHGAAISVSYTVQAQFSFEDMFKQHKKEAYRLMKSLSQGWLPLA